MYKSVIASVLLLAAMSPVSAYEPRIVDADTFIYFGEPIRISGIDAPEMGQHCALPDGTQWDCSTAALNALDALLDGGVTCSNEGQDIYGRTLGICVGAHGDVGEAMIRQGLAWSFRKYDDRYDALEAVAKASGIGIWQAPSEEPWLLRERLWNAATMTHASDCPIKAAIGDDSTRTYYTPWAQLYDAVTITPDKGERWFCDEVEALNAGWVAPLWQP